MSERRAVLPLVTALLLAPGPAEAAAPERARTLRTPEGAAVSLAEVARGRPLAVVVTQGYWSEGCGKRLQAVAAVHRAVRALGADVVALDADEPATNATRRAQLALPFPILSDPDTQVLRGLDLWDEHGGHPAPAVVFLDHCGSLALRWPGRVPGGVEERFVLDVLRKLASRTHECTPLM